MLPIEKILCPTDFSDPSYGALKTADEFAIHFSAELILLHVVSPIPAIPASPAPSGFHIPTVLREMEASAKVLLDRVVQERLSEGTKPFAKIVHGSPADEIVRVAADEAADIIVIATHGLSGWRKFLFGSVAEKVIRLASCPVLSIQISPEED